MLGSSVDSLKAVKTFVFEDSISHQSEIVDYEVFIDERSVDLRSILEHYHLLDESTTQIYSHNKNTFLRINDISLTKGVIP